MKNECINGYFQSKKHPNLKVIETLLVPQNISIEICKTFPVEFLFVENM